MAAHLPAPVKPFRAVHSDGSPIATFTTADLRDAFAQELADISGGIVYTYRWHPTVQSLMLDGGWIVEAHLAPGLPADAYITVSVTVENRYTRYDDITTTFEHVRIPAPPDLTDDVDTWAYDHISAFTGTGREDGDSFYEVTVTSCSDPALTGRTFTFGY